MIVLIFSIPTAIWGLHYLPVAIQNRTYSWILVTAILLLISFLIIRLVVNVFRTASRWFTLSEEERKPKFSNTKSVLFSCMKMPILAILAVGFMAWIVTLMIPMFVLMFLGINSNTASVIFTDMICLIPAIYVMWRLSSFGRMYTFEKKISIFANPEDVYKELDEQGVDVEEIDPYVLRISPNYILLAQGRGSYHIWQRKMLRCSPEIKQDDNYQVFFKIKDNGKVSNLIANEKMIHKVNQALCEACGTEDM